MNPKSVLSLLILLLLSSGTVNGQVLTLDKKPEAKADPIRLTGKIIEQKKYSFTMSSGEKAYEVKVPRGTPISMKLVRPRFDFENGKVWIAPEPIAKPVATDQSEPDNRAEKKPAPKLVSFNLPQPAYLTSQFTHATQMKRIMNAKILRLNNYTIQPTDPGAKLPSDKTDPIEISGKIEFLAERKQPVLAVGDQRFDLLLGHRGATMIGFSIATIAPEKVILSVIGVVGDDGIVNAQEILIRPIAAPTKTANK